MLVFHEDQLHCLLDHVDVSRDQMDRYILKPRSYGFPGPYCHHLSVPSFLLYVNFPGFQSLQAFRPKHSP